MSRTPEEIKQGVYEAIVGKGSWPKGDVRVFRACPGNGLPSFPLVCVTPESAFGNDEVGVRASLKTGRIGISLPGKHIGISYQEVQKGKVLNLRPDDSPTNNVHFAFAVTSVGTLSNELEGGLMVVVGTKKEVYNSESWQWEDKTSYQVRRLLAPVGWQEVTNGRLTVADFHHSLPDIAKMLQENPQLAFSTISALVKRLPVGARGIRDGYHPGHNDNPVRIEAKDGQIEARFLYPNVAEIASRVQDGQLTIKSFLRAGLAARYSLDNTDVISLVLKLEEDGKVSSSIAMTRLVNGVDEKKPTKWVAIDSACPFHLLELAQVGIGPNRFAEVLRENMCTPEALGTLFASLKPEKEVVGELNDRENTVIKVQKTASGRQNSGGSSSETTQRHRGGTRGNREKGKDNHFSTGPAGRTVEKKKLKDWKPHNKRGIHAVVHSHRR